MSTKMISLSLPVELLQSIDEYSIRAYSSRSEYIRQAVVMRMENEAKAKIQIQSQPTINQEPVTQASPIKKRPNKLYLTQEEKDAETEEFLRAYYTGEIE